MVKYDFVTQVENQGYSGDTMVRKVTGIRFIASLPAQVLPFHGIELPTRRRASALMGSWHTRPAARALYELLRSPFLSKQGMGTLQ